MTVFRLLVIMVLVALPAPASAQQNHDAHHDTYKGWVNQNDRGCCNNQDCGVIGDDDERTIGGKLEIRVQGEWCPVKPWMYLKKGNAPDWSSAHACVLRPYRYDDEDTPIPVCDRLICYQPKPLF